MIRIFSCLLAFGLYALVIRSPRPILSEEAWASCALSAADISPGGDSATPQSQGLDPYHQVLGLAARVAGSEGVRDLMLIPMIGMLIVFGWILADRIGTKSPLAWAIATLSILVFSGVILFHPKTLDGHGSLRLILIGWAGVVASTGRPSRLALSLGMLFMTLLVPGCHLAIPLLVFGIVHTLFEMIRNPRMRAIQPRLIGERVTLAAMTIALVSCIEQLRIAGGFENLKWTPIVLPAAILALVLGLIVHPLIAAPPQDEHPDTNEASEAREIRALYPSETADRTFALGLAILALPIPDLGPAALAVSLWRLGARARPHAHVLVLIPVLIGVVFPLSVTREQPDPVALALGRAEMIESAFLSTPFESFAPRVLVDPRVSGRILGSTALEVILLFDPRVANREKDPASWLVAVEQPDPVLHERLLAARIDALLLGEICPGRELLVGRSDWKARELPGGGFLVQRAGVNPKGQAAPSRHRRTSNHIRRAQVELERGNHCRANWESQSALWIESENPDALATRAQVLVYVGDIAGVRENVNRILERDDRDFWQPQIEARMTQALRLRETRYPLHSLSVGRAQDPSFQEGAP